MNKAKQDAKGDADAESAPTVDRSAPMWKVVEKASEQNKLQDLRDGKLRRSQKASEEETNDQDLFKSSKKTSAKSVNETSKQKKMKDKAAIPKKDKAKAETGTVVDANMEDDDDDETGAGFFE